MEKKTSQKFQQAKNNNNPKMNLKGKAPNYGDSPHLSYQSI